MSSSGLDKPPSETPVTAVDPDATGPTVDAAFPAPDPGFALGTRLGRYELVSQVGVGGMGVVFEARDPELDRTVAVKIFSGKGESSEEGHARLRREGQIMARLTHPNVLRVYDVGVAQGFVFVAMEFVAGGTLRDWLKRTSRTPEEILAIFTQAGRGLAAAHDAGLVHRDFKPSNVLVGDDGRVLVMDFGLAKPADGSATDMTISSPSSPPTSPMITRAGQRVGTPAFMAPEQHDDAPIDARADQFSFCVALWRALYETAPYAGLTVEMILAAARKGELAEPALKAAARVPSRVRAVLERGLRASPAERFASMRELLDALAPPPSRGRAWMWAAGGALALAAAAVSWGVLGRGASVVSDPCAAAVDRFAGVWDDEAAGAVKQAFVATGQPFAERAFAEVARQLDGRRRAFATMRRESCEATLVRREQSDTMMDLRTACLDRQQQEVASLVSALRKADAEAFRRAPSAAATAGDPAHCADTAALARRVPLPTDPARRAAIAAVERDIAAARAAIAAGRGRAAIDETVRVIAAARTVDHAPTLAYALYTAAILNAEIEDAPRAEALFREALLAGDAGGDDNLRFECEARLVSVVGYQLERRDDANRHAEQAAALLARLGPDPSRTALLAKNHAISEWWNGRYDDAKRLARQSVAEYEKVDPDGIRVAEALHNLAIAQDDSKEHADALATEERALAIAERALGPEHPFVARAKMAASGALRRLGRLDEARRMIDDAVRIFERSYGPDSPFVASGLLNMATLEMNDGKFDAAIGMLRRVVAMYEKELGPDHSRVAMAAERLGSALSKAGRYPEAQVSLDRAVQINRARFGPNHPAVADSLRVLGEHYLRAGEPAKARAAFAESVRAIEAAPDAPRTLAAEPLTALGDAELALGQRAAARRDYQRALAAVAPDDVDSREKIQAKLSSLSLRSR